MKIGISALLFNLDDAIEICKNEKDISHIEIGIDNIEECRTLLTYKEIFKELNISISIHLPMELNTCENISYIRNSWIEFINKIYDELKPLKVKYYNMHLGYAMTNRLSKNREMFLNNSLKFFNDKNLNKEIFISIENTYSNYGDFSNIGNKVEDFEYIFNNSKNKRLSFCYDTGHFLINKSNYIEKLTDKLKVVHLSDNNGIEDQHIGIGKGILNKKHIKDIIKRNIDYLILEMNFDHIKETLVNLKDL